MFWLSKKKKKKKSNNIFFKDKTWKMFKSDGMNIIQIIKK